MADSQNQQFSSRLGLLLSVLGIAVGTGNIWRFPRIAAQNAGDDGAGAFLLVWLLFLFVWSVPLIIAEYALGKKGRMGVIGAFTRMAGEKYTWMGGYVGFVATAIMFYYSVVAGWCIYYFIQTLTAPLPLSAESASMVWDNFQGGLGPVGFHAIAMGVGAIVVLKGVSAIERANRFLIPALLAIVLVAVVRTLTLEGAWDGVRFLFTPSWDTLSNPRLWLEALTQNAWDTGAGWGLILSYAVYMQARHGAVKNAFITGVGNNMVSLLSAIVIFGTVFAILGREMQQGEILTVMQTSGPASTGLTFQWMPQLFAQMGFGRVLASLFFLGLSFAAFSSLISMIELATRIVVDAGVARKQAVGGICIIGFVMGIPSAINLNIFANQDFVWGVGLMLCGAFVAFAVIRYGLPRFRTEIVDSVEGDWKAGPIWDFIIGKVVPTLAIVLLVWWFYLSARVYAPDTWYDPFDPFSVMTIVVQWALVIGVFVALNKWLARRTLANVPPDA
ncbi:MAG: sodium-dependent transporter [Rhodothermales bacterium]|nr:sodium-dependent transporter [Rhodothermales bacterium]MBO6779734.1 sodium-dependent transporter [Rhodothermales bacterium]